MTAKVTEESGAEDAETPQRLWGIDDVVPKDPTEFDPALDSWQQGDLVLEVPLTWLAPEGEDPLTGVTAYGSGISPIKHDELRAAAAIICTQTCDLGPASPGDKHPFFLVAPVVHMDTLQSKGTARRALEGRVTYLFPVSSPIHEEREEESRGQQKQWFADFRLMMAASKTLLIGRDRLPGFVNELDRLHFSETLAFKFRRPALHPVLSEDLPQIIDGFVRSQGPTNRAFAKTEQVRLFVTEGTHLNPTSAHIFIITRQDLTETEEDFWRRWEKLAIPVLRAQGIELAPTLFESPETMSASLYRTSNPLRIESLATHAWW